MATPLLCGAAAAATGTSACAPSNQELLSSRNAFSDICYCPACQAERASRRRARQRSDEQYAEARRQEHEARRGAEQKLKEQQEKDKRLQEIDPMNSAAYKQGGDSRVRGQHGMGCFGGVYSIPHPNRKFSVFMSCM